jgi:hypothetical protein
MLLGQIRESLFLLFQIKLAQFADIHLPKTLALDKNDYFRNDFSSSLRFCMT